MDKKISAYTDARVGALTTEDRAGNREHWLKVPLGRGWTATYRLTLQGSGDRQTARIRELRVVPVLGHDFHPRGLPAHPELYSKSPFSFDAIHRHVTARRFKDALFVVGANFAHAFSDDDLPPNAPAPQLEPPPPRPRIGRPLERDAKFYAKFAVRYDAVENRSRRDAGESTRARLAREYDVPITTIGKWIRMARQHGFLSPVRKGQRGGMVSPTAFQVARQRGKA